MERANILGIAVPCLTLLAAGVLCMPGRASAEGPRVRSRIENGVRIVELPEVNVDDDAEVDDDDDSEGDSDGDDVDAGDDDGARRHHRRPHRRSAARHVAYDDEGDDGDLGATEIPEGALRPVLAARAGLAFGGEGSAEILGTRLRSNMKTSLWMGAEFSYPLLPYVAIGGEVRSIWWQTDGDDDAGVGHHWLLDAAPFVKVAYPLHAGSSWGRVYARVPVGLTVSRLNSDIDSVNRVSTSVGLGWNLAGYAGVEWFFGRWGVGGELGYLYHSFSNSVDAGGRHGDLSTSFGQFGFHLHAAMTL